MQEPFSLHYPLQHRKGEHLITLRENGGMDTLHSLVLCNHFLDTGLFTSLQQQTRVTGNVLLCGKHMAHEQSNQQQYSPHAIIFYSANLQNYM